MGLNLLKAILKGPLKKLTGRKEKKRKDRNVNEAKCAGA